jgi:ferredoxin-NADP reductase
MWTSLATRVGALYDFTSYGVGVYFLCYIPMSLLAIRIIRKVKYKIFYAVHQLWIVAVIFTMLHFPLGSVNQLGFSPGLVLQIADRLGLLCTPTIAAEGNTISSAKTSESSAPVSTADVFSLRVFTKQTNSWLSETMLYQKIASLFEVIFRDANEGLGQYYFINAPAISMVEWHPFSVSQMNEQSMTFHIKTCKPGSCTCKLLTYIQDSTATSPNGQVDVEVQLRGPYGSLSVNLADYSHIFLIAGGIGITPMLPILDSIRSQRKKYPCLRKVTIVWAARKENESLFCEFADQITDFVDISGWQSASSNMESREVVGAEAGDGDLELTVLGQAEVEVSQRKQRSVGPSLYAGVHSSACISVEVEYYLTGEKESNRDTHEFTSSSGSDNKHTCVYGHPNFKSLAKNAVKQAEQPQLATGRNAVCAFVCGTAAMSTDAAVACADNGKTLTWKLLGGKFSQSRPVHVKFYL